MQIYGAVEFRIADEWYDVINIAALLLGRSDLFGCLFGVQNYAGYVPLFPDRGFPSDCSYDLKLKVEPFVTQVSNPSWALWSELKRINWDELATRNDERITELAREGDFEKPVTKWLHAPDLQGVRDALDRDPNATVTIGNRMFKRLILKRRDSLDGTEFPLVMTLMECLAERYGDEAVRLTVWFD
jgi:hypothetical protein